MAGLETRRLGRTEMRPKALGLGCAFLGTPQRVSEEGAIQGESFLGRKWLIGKKIKKELDKPEGISHAKMV